MTIKVLHQLEHSLQKNGSEPVTLGKRRLRRRMWASPHDSHLPCAPRHIGRTGDDLPLSPAWPASGTPPMTRWRPPVHYLIDGELFSVVQHSK